MGIGQVKVNPQSAASAGISVMAASSTFSALVALLAWLHPRTG